MPAINPKPLRDTPLTLLAVLFMVIATLSLASAVLIPIALALLLAFILMPIVIYLQRSGVPRNLSVTLVSLAAFGLFGFLLYAITIQLHDLVKEIPQQRENIRLKVKDIAGDSDGPISRLFSMMDEIVAELEPTQPSGEEAIVVRQAETRTFIGLALIPVVAQPVIRVLGSAALVIVLTLFMLARREDLRNRILRLVGHRELASTTRAMDEATRLMSSYLFVEVCLNAAFGLVFGLGLYLIGVPYSFLWGFFAAVFRFIPYIGTWLAGVLPFLVSLASEGWAQPVGVIVLLLILGLTLNSILEPMLVSRSTGISPIALIVATAFWTWLWGPIGLILATPMTVCLSVLGRYVEGLRFFDILLGTQPALAPQHSFYQRLLAQDDDEAAELAEEFLETHTIPELCDEVIIPALTHARFDQQRGHLDKESAVAVGHLTREVFEEIVESNNLPTTGKPIAVGFPVRGPIDEAALALMDSLLGEYGQIRPMENSGGSTGLIDLIEREGVRAVCLGTVAPGGQARVRYLCRRLRTRFPGLWIVIAYLGLGEEQLDKVRERLMQSGADQVFLTAKEMADRKADVIGKKA